MEYLIYILIGWGVTDFLVNGSILDGIRSYLLVKIPLLAKLLSCIRCSGFWVGVLMGLLSLQKELYPFLIESEILKINIVQIFASGFLISGSSILINSLIIYFYSFRIRPYSYVPEENQEDPNNNQPQDEKN